MQHFPVVPCSHITDQLVTGPDWQQGQLCRHGTAPKIGIDACGRT